MPNSFNSFSVGDLTTFERLFQPEDFAAFSAISGNTNPLYRDETYALSTRFGRPIVPLHLVLAPLSYIAGMVFPGGPSLYLGHQVRASLPVYYNERLRYSARITAINADLRILTLRVLALRDVEIVLDAEMRVQVTADEWISDSVQPILHSDLPGRALVTGASGAIGKAIALALAAQGWALLLHDRGDGPHRKSITAALRHLERDVQFVAADLAVESGRKALAAAAKAHDNIDVIIHTASPGLMSPLEGLVAVNYSALKDLSSATIPAMLARQRGRIILIGSTATMRTPLGWEDYAAAKTMAGGLVAGIENRFSAYDVRGLVLALGYVATPFSESVRGSAPALLPEEIAEAVVGMIEAPNAPAVVLEVGRRIAGQLGFSSVNGPGPVTASNSKQQHVSAATTASKTTLLSAEVSSLVRRILRLPSDVELDRVKFGMTSGWDSLSHIELILALESKFQIQFTSGEIMGLDSFDALVIACSKKLSTVNG